MISQGQGGLLVGTTKNAILFGSMDFELQPLVQVCVHIDFSSATSGEWRNIVRKLAKFSYRNLTTMMIKNNAKI